MKEHDFVLPLSDGYKGYRFWAEAFEVPDGYMGKYRIHDSTSDESQFSAGPADEVVVDRVFDRAVDARTAAAEAARKAIDAKVS